jgi:hypothetical protein
MNNWYKKSQQQEFESIFSENDLVSAKYKGTPYLGHIIDIEFQDGVNKYWITFNEIDNIYRSENPDYELTDWMEKDFSEGELEMIKPAIKWEEFQDESDLDLTKIEEFYYGMGTWDVREAKRILYQNPRPKTTFPVESVKHYVESGKIAITPKIMKMANLSIPLILISTKYNDEVSNFPIDGWHRIAKALKEGVKELPAYLLTLEETESIES